MNRTGSGNRGGRSRKRPTSRIDSETVRIIKCKFCKQPITFGYNSIGRDGKKIPTNLDGTMHMDGGRK